MLYKLENITFDIVEKEGFFDLSIYFELIFTKSSGVELYREIEVNMEKTGPVIKITNKENGKTKIDEINDKEIISFIKKLLNDKISKGVFEQNLPEYLLSKIFYLFPLPFMMMLTKEKCFDLNQETFFIEYDFKNIRLKATLFENGTKSINNIIHLLDQYNNYIKMYKTNLNFNNESLKTTYIK